MVGVFVLLRSSSIACVVLATAVSCAPAEEGEASHQPRPSDTAETGAAETPERLAVTAYEGLMDTVVEGSHQGATDHPYLQRYAKGQALELARDMLDGATATGEPVLEPKVVESDPDGSPPTVVIEDCADDSQWVLEGVDPEPAEADDFRPHRVTVTSDGSSWKVQELWFGDYGGC
jgi:hypothetical protein